MKLISYLVLLLWLTALPACNKTNHSNSSAVNVYLGGQIKDGSGAYWKNGELVALPSSMLFNPEFTALAIHADNVYAVGPESTQIGNSLFYWENGKRFTLAVNLHGYLKGTASADGSYYIVGTTGPSAENIEIWKDGIPSLIRGSAPNYYYEASGIAVSGNDIYVSGRDNGVHSLAAYWKNGQKFILSDSVNAAYTTSIMVSGNDVYVTGFQERASGNYKAIYWKNGSPMVLSDTSVGAIAYGIAVSGTDVYVSGTVGDMITYWKNGIPVYLHDKNESVSVGIAVYNGDVYVCGSFYDNYIVGGYWKNNNFVPVNGASEDVYVTSILVTGQ